MRPTPLDETTELLGPIFWNLGRAPLQKTNSLCWPELKLVLGLHRETTLWQKSPKLNCTVPCSTTMCSDKIGNWFDNSILWNYELCAHLHVVARSDSKIGRHNILVTANTIGSII
jgi:hypothetical protein